MDTQQKSVLLVSLLGVARHILYSLTGVQWSHHCRCTSPSIFHLKIMSEHSRGCKKKSGRRARHLQDPQEHSQDLKKISAESAISAKSERIITRSERIIARSAKISAKVREIFRICKLLNLKFKILLISKTFEIFGDNSYRQFLCSHMPK
jgi:hypothetical protein